ncbi:MAG: hypothetical protein FJX55_16965, partial [Alphaproteobacteria bacterium]|nr:hypothetical protein [Alphaproteobacteria bacterium]
MTPNAVDHTVSFSLAQSAVDAVVSLVDLFPTLLDMATDGNRPDLAAPVDGNSLLPLMTGKADDWPDIAVSEYSDMGVCAPCRMVRAGELK